MHKVLVDTSGGRTVYLSAIGVGAVGSVAAAQEGGGFWVIRRLATQSEPLAKQPVIPFVIEVNTRFGNSHGTSSCSGRIHDLGGYSAP